MVPVLVQYRYRYLWYSRVRCLLFVGGKEDESSIEEQVDFTELDSGVRGETEDSSQSIELDIRYRYTRSRRDGQRHFEL